MESKGNEVSGLALIAAFYLMGQLLDVVGILIPGSVLGLLLLSAALFLGLVRIEWVEEGANLLLRHMLLFFAPSIVGVIAFLPLLRAEWLPIAVTWVISLILVLLTTGWTARLLLGRELKAAE